MSTVSSPDVLISSNQYTPKMATKRILEGSFEGLPEQESTTIRIFFSSTFTDMSSERNILMKEAVPYLRNYCLGKGLDFQVVDMRWGVREEMLIDQMSTELCLREIAKCQKISRGPNFVALVGNRYGSCPLPSSIPIEDFKIFHRVAAAMGKDLSLLDKWYLIDNNSLPPVYQIQPITDILPHYNETNPAKQHLQEKAQKRWQEVKADLKSLFHELSQEAFKSKQMEQSAMDKYFISVTENEIKKGILEASDISHRILCFHRNITDMNLMDKLAWRYIDLDPDNNEDLYAKERREKLTKTKIPSAVSDSQMYHYDVKWRENGVDVADPEHSEYLQTFCSDFQSSMIKMINASLEKSLASEDVLVTEVLHHLHFSLKKSQVFFGREDELEKIHKLLQNVVEDKGAAEIGEAEESADEEDSEEKMTQKGKELKSVGEFMSSMGVKFHVGDALDDFESDPTKNMTLQQIQLPTIQAFKRPVVVYGESGSGKTALMAKIAQLSATWVKDRTLIIRYLGTSAQSSSIRNMLVGICKQIWSMYDVQKVPSIDLNVDFQYLISYFRALLWKIDSMRKPLVIMFDSVDQLLPSDHAHTLNWLPTRIPKDVHLIVSMMPNIHNCLENAELHLPFPEQYVRLSNFLSAAGENMITALCLQKERCLNRLQKNFLMEQFSKCPQPLFLKLMIDEAVTWKSFTPLSDIEFGDTVRGGIETLFDNIERVHGPVVIAKAFGYLCGARQGLGDSEMEDLLSLDDEVLQDTYLYHLPPDARVIRLPPLLWKRIRSDISEYLTERQSGNKVVVNWYHRQFLEVAKQRYLSESVQKSVHSALADYFSGKWSNEEKPLELFKVKKGSYPNALRQVPVQPLVYENGSYNVRKLQELPYHTMQSGDLEGFHDNIACNFDWLYGMCKTISLTDAIADLKQALTSLDQFPEDKMAQGDNKLADVKDDIKLVHDVLVLGSDSIRRDPANVAVQIVSQLSPQYSGSSAVSDMVDAAYAWLQHQPVPCLLPQGKLMPSPGCLLSSVSASVHILGNDRVFGSCMELSESKRHLYVIEQRSSDNNDELRIYDLNDNMSCMTVLDLKSKVRSLKFKVAEKLLVLETFDTASKYSFKSHFNVFEGTLSAPYQLGCEPVNVAISKYGRMLAWSDRTKVKIGKLNKKGRGVDIKHEFEAKSCYVMFSADDKFLVTFSDDASKIYDIEKGDIVADLTPSEKVFNWSDGDSDYARKTFVTEDNKFIHPGFGYSGKRHLYVNKIPSGEELFKLEGHEHYDLDLCDLDRKEEFLIAGTTCSSVINGIGEKQAKIFSLQSGEQTGTVNCVNGPYQDLKIFGNEELWLLVAADEDSKMYLMSAGTRENPIHDVVLMRTVSDHSQAILQYLISENENILFSASADNTIKMWDLPRLLSESKDLCSKMEETEAAEQSIDVQDVGHTTSLLFSEDDRHLYIGTRNGSVLRRDTVTGSTERIISEPLLRYRQKRRLMKMCCAGKYLAVGLKGRVIVLDAKTAKQVYDLKHVARDIDCLAEGGNVLVAGTAGMEAKGRLWNLTTGDAIRDVTYLYSFYSTAVNHAGTRFIMTMFDYPIIFNVEENEKEEDNLVGQPDTMMAACCEAAFSPDDKFAVACSGDGSIRVMNASNNKYLYHMKQRSSITNATFTPDGKNFLTSGYRSVYVWLMSDGSLDCKLTRHQDFVVCMEFAHKGKFLVTTSQDKTIVIWDFEKKTSVCSFLAHCQVNAMAVTSDASLITYAPENVASVGELRPNVTLSKILAGTFVRKVPESLRQAQAVALGFSGQKIRNQSSAACAIL